MTLFTPVVALLATSAVARGSLRVTNTAVLVKAPMMPTGGIKALPHVMKALAVAHAHEAKEGNNDEFYPCEAEATDYFTCMGNEFTACFFDIIEDLEDDTTCKDLENSDFCEDVVGGCGASPTPAEKYYHKAWAELPEEIQCAYRVLGWNQETWTTGQDIPDTDMMYWDDLSHEQQIAAAVIGYTKEIWDGHETNDCSATGATLETCAKQHYPDHVCEGLCEDDAVAISIEANVMTTMSLPHVAKALAVAHEAKEGNDDASYPCEAESTDFFTCMGNEFTACYLDIIKDLEDDTTCEDLENSDFCEDVVGGCGASVTNDCMAMGEALETCAKQHYPDYVCEGLCEENNACHRLDWFSSQRMAV